MTKKKATKKRKTEDFEIVEETIPVALNEQTKKDCIKKACDLTKEIQHLKDDLADHTKNVKSEIKRRQEDFETLNEALCRGFVYQSKELKKKIVGDEVHFLDMDSGEVLYERKASDLDLQKAFPFRVHRAAEQTAEC